MTHRHGMDVVPDAGADESRRVLVPFPLPPARLATRPVPPNDRVVRFPLVLALATACSGTAGVREYSEALAVAPPICAPVVVLISIGSVAAHSRSELALPGALVMKVVRTGKSTMRYEAEACATGDGVVVGEPTRTTGFAELDEVLRGEVANVALPPGECMNVALLASRFECQ